METDSSGAPESPGPIRLADEQQALRYAKEVFPTFGIILLGIIKRRYAPSQCE